MLYNMVSQAYQEQRAKFTHMSDDEFLAFAGKWQERARAEVARVGQENWSKWLGLCLALTDESAVRLQGALVGVVREGTDAEKAEVAAMLRYMYEKREGE